MSESKRALKHFSKELEKYKQRIEDCPIEWPAQKRTLSTLAGYYETAVSALRAQAERQNPKPLTLEELRERVGKPVWRVGVNVKEWIFPAAVSIVPYKQIWFFDSDGYAHTALCEHEKYYDHPPKEDA